MVAVYTPLIAEALQAWVPGVEDPRPRSASTSSTGLWLPAGRGTTTPNCTRANTTRQLTGHLDWISPPLPGSVHDAKAIKESGFLEALDAAMHIGDKGYIGLGMITPIRKPTYGELTDTDKRNNTTINRVRYIIEHVITNIKTLRVLHTDYRRPYKTHLRNHNTSRHGTHLRLHPVNKPH